MRYMLSRARPIVYILIISCVSIAAVLYKFRTDNIFACQASGYTADRYLSYCDVKNYGDYEHGAFWFDLEPAAQTSAANADALFLGDSRTQFAFSTAATERWFSSELAKYYLLGFIASENSVFARALLHKLKPRARVYVVAIGDFFEPTERVVAKTVLHDKGAADRYEGKRLLQFVHKTICVRITIMCGNDMEVFRSREAGTWYLPATTKFKGRERGVSYDEQADDQEIGSAAAIGRIVLSELPVKTDCVILTLIPTVDTKLRAARAIASRLGKSLIVPEHLDGLRTFDGTHLDQGSAERWSEAFFKTAGPEIKSCLRD